MEHIELLKALMEEPSLLKATSLGQVRYSCLGAGGWTP